MIISYEINVKAVLSPFFKVEFFHRIGESYSLKSAFLYVLQFHGLPTNRDMMIDLMAQRLNRGDSIDPVR